MENKKAHKRRPPCESSSPDHFSTNELHKIFSGASGVQASSTPKKNRAEGTGMVPRIKVSKSDDRHVRENSTNISTNDEKKATLKHLGQDDDLLTKGKVAATHKSIAPISLAKSSSHGSGLTSTKIVADDVSLETSNADYFTKKVIRASPRKKKTTGTHKFKSEAASNQVETSAPKHPIAQVAISSLVVKSFKNNDTPSNSKRNEIKQSYLRLLANALSDPIL
ncbi:hypothetical protein CJJ07_004014 [Candidozyma auris]|nr:hypothetical protein CJJ07_004014 [[Candida] auris]